MLFADAMKESNCQMKDAPHLTDSKEADEEAKHIKAKSNDLGNNSSEDELL